MYYIIYIDVYFLVNFLLNGLLLCLLKWCEDGDGSWFEKKNIGRILSGAALGGILSCLALPLLSEHPFWVGNIGINVIVSWFMLRTAFGTSKVREQVQKVIRFVLMEILVSGMLQLLLFPADFSGNGKPKEGIGAGTVLVTVGIIVLILGEIRKEEKRKRQIQSHLYTVRFAHKGKEAEEVALLDTGNHLKDPVTGRGVVIVQAQLARKLLGELETARIMAVAKGKTLDYLPENPVKLIPFHSLGQLHGMMSGILVEQMTVYTEQGEKIHKKVQIGIMEEGLSGEQLYGVILHECYIREEVYGEL